MSRAWISEIFSSFQGEGASIAGSCFGKRQIFIRFSGCDLAMQNNACAYCDTPYAWKIEEEEAKVYLADEIRKIKNPLSAEQVFNIVKALESRDLHSISFTGGEPLLQINALLEIAEKLSKSYKLYLETSGSMPENAEKAAKYFTYACVDIKDRGATKLKNWREIFKRELKTIKILKKNKVKVFAKVVISKNSNVEDMKTYARELKKLDVALAIQVAMPLNITEEELLRFSEAAAEHLEPENVAISLQMHKFLKIK